MLAPAPPDPTPVYRTGAAVMGLAAAVILGALAFEHIGGYLPCPLCLQQRYAYYASIPLLGVALAIAAANPRSAAVLFLAVALAFLANAGLGAYHAGVEWKLWAGPDTCGTIAPAPRTPADLLGGVQSTPSVRCDEPALTVLGLSLAVWNAVMSLVLSAGALWAAYLALPKR